MSIKTDKEKIEDILNRGIDAIYNKEELEELLLSGRQLNIKLGIDVTGPLIHLGSSVVLRKLRDFQELGHKVTLIIGDFTTLIGDHSDKVDMREDRTVEQIREDEKNYKAQFFKVVIPELTEVRHNSEWLSNLKMDQIITYTKLFTVAQMIKRENFKERYEQEKPIRLSEFLYPIMQGYDSIAIKADIEIGGSEQTFNILAGRRLMESVGLKPQIGLTMKLLKGNDGRKMGKSLKNYIPITANNVEMYVMVMQIVDEVIIDYFELVTRVPLGEIEEIRKRIEKGENPMNFKKRLAYEIVKLYHGDKLALEAQEEFERVVQKKELPKDLHTLIISPNSNILDVLQKAFNYSKSQSKRLVQQKAIKFNDVIIDSVDYVIKESGILKAGKKDCIRLEVPN